MRQTATDYLALQERWKTDAKTLDTMRNELAQVQDTLARERERRESAEADALRANARLEALEPLLNQLTPAQNAVKKTRRGHAQDGEPTDEAARLSASGWGGAHLSSTPIP